MSDLFDDYADGNDSDLWVYEGDDEPADFGFDPYAGGPEMDDVDYPEDPEDGY